jgi:hypothetical protein
MFRPEPRWLPLPRGSHFLAKDFMAYNKKSQGGCHGFAGEKLTANLLSGPSHLSELPRASFCR